MASKTLTAQLLSVPEQLISPVYEKLKEFPIYLLILLFVAFLGTVFLTVSYIDHQHCETALFLPYASLHQILSCIASYLYTCADISLPC